VNGFGGPNNDIPIVRQRKVDTSIVVKDGRTVLIGGLFNSSDTESGSRFPILSQVPVIGTFFKSNRTQKDQTELVIALTPKIIRFDFEEKIPELMLKQ
jgi:type II secretory pathway component GspD/PulD (secretin)